MTTPTNTPWVVHSCGNPDHGPEWECHRVKDSAGRTLLQSVTREVAERYASVPTLLEQLASAEARGLERAREQVSGLADDLEDASAELNLAAGHKANPGSTNGTLVQQSQRLYSLAQRIRAMTDERAGGETDAKREWHRCSNPGGHRFSEGVCTDPDCDMDLRKT